MHFPRYGSRRPVSARLLSTRLSFSLLRSIRAGSCNLQLHVKKIISKLVVFYIFSCHFRLLADCDTWIGDGTFELAADKFKQMYTIHGYTLGHTVPLVSFCLRDKKAGTYDAMLQMLQRLCVLDSTRNAKRIEMNSLSAWRPIGRQTITQVCQAGIQYHLRRAHNLQPGP